MKKIIFLLSLLFVFTSCDKEVTPEPPVSDPCTKQFVEMIANNNYDLTFYHNGVEVEPYLLTPVGSNFMTGFNAHSGDSVRVTVMPNNVTSVLKAQIRIEGIVIMDSIIWQSGGNPPPPITLSVTLP